MSLDSVNCLETSEKRESKVIVQTWKTVSKKKNSFETRVSSYKNFQSTVVTCLQDVPAQQWRIACGSNPATFEWT